MLTCITCSKQRREEDTPRGCSSKEDAVKSLTSQQIKDMALKVSGNYKGKPGPTDDNFMKVQTSFPDFNTISEGVPYPRFTAFGGDRTPHPRGLESFSAQTGQVMLENKDEPKEWMAQVEPGVHITFVSLPKGGNDLKRIRFSCEMFNKWQAQRWWGENYDRIMELYNVQKFNQQALSTPGRSEDGRDSSYSRLGYVRDSPRMTPSLNNEWTPRNNFPGSNQHYYNDRSSAAYTSKAEMEASRTTTSSRDEASVSISNASDIEAEWIEEDEPGVYLTIRQLADGTRELRRVRFSREKFGEVRAKLWWETNRDRIQVQHLS